MPRALPRGGVAICAVTLAVALMGQAPAPTPLHEIGGARAVGLCRTLGQNIAPALLGLMKDDELIGAGHRAFRKMASDLTARSDAALVLDRNYVDEVVSAMVHNLKVVDAKLGDAKRFPGNPVTEDDLAAVRLRARLEAVAAQQRNALNLLSGTVETQRMGEMRADINTQMESATGQSGAAAPTAPADASFIGAAGLSQPAPYGVMTPGPTSALGHTMYDELSRALEARQDAIGRAEVPASAGVIEAADACKAAPASASPAASP